MEAAIVITLQRLVVRRGRRTCPSLPSPGSPRTRGIAIIGLLACILGVPAVQARETVHLFPIQPVLESEKGKNKLSDVALYFGNQKHPKIVEDLGVFATNKKTNAFGKSDRVACDWVFLSALIQLQERALLQGGNAVVNIKSNYKNVEVVNDDEYRCGAGNVMAGVALIGTVVKIEK